jgi:hypothetical protein
MEVSVFTDIYRSHGTVRAGGWNGTVVWNGMAKGKAELEVLHSSEDVIMEVSIPTFTGRMER